MNKRHILRAMLIVIALMLLPCAFAENQVAFNTESRVYVWPDLGSTYISVPAGLKVTQADDAETGWTRVELNGASGYTNAAHLTKVDSQPENSVTPIQKSAIVTENTLVFAAPRLNAASMRIPKGMRLTLVAVSGDWAMVANGNLYAYMNQSQIEVCEAFSYNESLNAYAAQITQNASVYAMPHRAALSIGVPKGMQVSLLKVQDGWALIENAGIRAYIEADKVSLIDQTPDPTPTPTPTPAPTPDYSDLLKNAVAAELTADAHVYAQPSDTAEKTVLSKGTRVNFLMANGDWALIELNGNYGYISRMFLSPVTDSTPVPNPTENPGSTLDYMNSSKYSNEQKCYFYLTREMGLNSAAACGILSNIKAECSFNPNDQTGKYYGICQWGDGRLSNMKKYCEKNGYDYTSLEGQLRFLQYELASSYPKVLKMLKETSDTPQGAYEAGYNFCYDYERPANKAASSVKRGNMAKDTYYPKYI